MFFDRQVQIRKQENGRLQFMLEMKANALQLS